MSNGENEESGLEESLVSSIATADLVDMGADLAEVGLDQFLAEGVLRDVPILGTLAGMYRTFGVVRDRVFTSKVVRFLVQLAEIPVADRQRFLAQHVRPADRRRLGETLVLLLDRLDDMQKPEALAHLFAAHVRGECDLETFRKLAAALDRIPLSAISHLRDFYHAQEAMPGLQPPRPGEYHAQFIFAGLVSIEFSRTGPTGGPGGRYAKNELGELFLKTLAVG